MSFECELDLGMPDSYKALKQELSFWARLKRFPLYGTFEITPYCNLHCPMCYVRLDPATAIKQGKLLSGKQWLEIGRQAKELGMLFVTLTGGEPFLHPDFWEIYNGLTEMGMLVDIYSNGCLINEEIVERLKANPPLNMKISIYGASDETYETMCGYKNGFTKLKHALGLLKEAGIPFYCTSMLVHENKDDLQAIYAFAHSLQIRYFHTLSVASSVRDALSDPERSRLKPSECGWTLEAMEKERHTKRFLEPFALCAGYGTTVFLTWHGRLQFCAFSPKPMVQAGGETDFATAWARLLEQTDRIKTPVECETCEYHEFCRRCPGLVASESGDPSVLNPKFCEHAKEMTRIYRELKAEAACGQKDEGDTPVSDAAPL